MLAIAAFLALTAPNDLGNSATTVVINEFSYDDSGTDNREFVELYNASDKAVDISNWILDSEDQSGANAAYTIPANTVLKAGDFWVLGSASVPNVDQVVGATNLWENSNESLTLRDANKNPIDTLIYEANKGIFKAALAEGDGVWGNFTSIDGRETSWSRVRDGQDTDNNGNDFRLAPSTPGKTNNIKSILPYADDFDGYKVGDPLAEWGSSFAPARVIDPTVADTDNPNAIAASPEGGKAAIFWDRAGGGNLNMLLTDGSREALFEAYVYFDAKLEPQGQREVWSVGLQGTSGTFFNFPDPSKTAGFTANGNTGVCWTYEVTDKAATLYLVDNNDGGTDHTVVGKIEVKQGVNDGWQRLRLHATGGTVEGRFGGTFGFGDGTRIVGSIKGAVSGIWIGYREGLSANATARPFTMDGVRISAPCSDLTVAGNGQPGTQLKFALTGGAARTLAILFMGPRTGETVVRLGPLGTLELGLRRPFVPSFMGGTDGNGNVSMSVRVPPGRIPRVDLFGQATTVDVMFHRGPPKLDFCTTDVEGFKFGGR